MGSSRTTKVNALAKMCSEDDIYKWRQGLRLSRFPKYTGWHNYFQAALFKRFIDQNYLKIPCFAIHDQ